jgi:hypothetical protein
MKKGSAKSEDSTSIIDDWPDTMYSRNEYIGYAIIGYAIDILLCCVRAPVWRGATLLSGGVAAPAKHA